jgi:hypothetical protein
VAIRKLTIASGRANIAIPARRDASEVLFSARRSYASLMKILSKFSSTVFSMFLALW